MDIIYDERTRCFHLRNKHVSYIMKVINGGYLAHLYWGRRIEHYHESNDIVLYDRGFCANPNPEDRIRSPKSILHMEIVIFAFPHFKLNWLMVPEYVI